MYGWIEADLSLWTNRKRLCFVLDAVVSCVPNRKPATHALILHPIMVDVVKLSVLTRTCLPQMNCINALRTRYTARNSNAVIQYPVSQGGSQTPGTTLSSQSESQTALALALAFSHHVLGWYLLYVVHSNDSFYDLQIQILLIFNIYYYHQYSCCSLISL